MHQEKFDFLPKTVDQKGEAHCRCCNIVVSEVELSKIENLIMRIKQNGKQIRKQLICEQCFIEKYNIYLGVPCPHCGRFIDRQERKRIEYLKERLGTEFYQIPAYGICADCLLEERKTINCKS